MGFNRGFKLVAFLITTLMVVLRIAVVLVALVVVVVVTALARLKRSFSHPQSSTKILVDVDNFHRGVDCGIDDSITRILVEFVVEAEVGSVLDLRIEVVKS